MSIHDMARLGRLPELKRAIAREGVDVRNSQQYTALMVAAVSPHAGTDVLQLLIAAGADVNAVAETKIPHETTPITQVDTVLSQAAAGGSLEKIRLLLDAGADIHYERPHGYRVMLDLCHGRDIRRDADLLPAVDLLLRRGAAPNPVSDFGESPLRRVAGVGRFDVVRQLLEAGVDAAGQGWSDLFLALISGAWAAVDSLLAAGADIEARDARGLTPFLLCVLLGDVARARLLAASGADIQAATPHGQTAVMLAIQADQAEMLRWLMDQGADYQARDARYDQTPLLMAVEHSSVGCLRVLLAAGVSPHQVDGQGQPAVSVANELDIVRQLLAAGADLHDANLAMRHAFLGLDIRGVLAASREDYEAGWPRQFGRRNPERMAPAFWQAMVYTRLSAWSARAAFGDPRSAAAGPVWCNQRFGQTITALPDGRYVEIGGEHEDWYDIDFCIYNDVIVYDSDGSFEIFGYPEPVFPPTDFHSATLISDVIYIIGGLGYKGQRISGETPVFRLHCGSWRMSRVHTTGHKPGWISRHRAHAVSDTEIVVSGGKIWTEVNGEELVEDNGHRYALDLVPLTWRRIA